MDKSKKFQDIQVTQNSNVMFVILAIIIGCFLFFFNSKTLLQSVDEMVYTPIGEQVEFGSKNISVISWEYSENQKKMELQLSITQKNTISSSLNTDYSFDVLTRAGQVNANIIAQFDDVYIIQIDDVSPKFKEMSFRIIDDSTYADLFTNYAKVEKVDEIKLKTEKQYQEDSVKNMISVYQNNITTSTSEITEHEEKIKALKISIAEQESKKKYQTAQQIEETQRIIEGYENEISTEQTSIETLNNTIEEYNDRIQLLQQQLNDLGVATQ